MVEDKDITYMDKEELIEHRKLLEIGIKSIKITVVNPELATEEYKTKTLEISQVDDLLKHF